MTVLYYNNCFHQNGACKEKTLFHLDYSNFSTTTEFPPQSKTQGRRCPKEHERHSHLRDALLQ